MLFKNVNEKRSINYKEIKIAEEIIIKETQMFYFQSFFDNDCLDLKFKIWGIINYKGILRCQQRIMQTSSSRESPILLPSGDIVTKLIIEDIHRKLMHANTQFTLTQFGRLLLDT